MVADGLPLIGGAQIAVDTTLVSALHCDGSALGGAANRDGVPARRCKERTYPELAAPWSRCRLVVMASEVGGRWSSEALAFLRQLAKAKARSETPLMRRCAEQARKLRWLAIMSPVHCLNCEVMVVPTVLCIFLVRLRLTSDTRISSGFALRGGSVISFAWWDLSLCFHLCGAKKKVLDVHQGEGGEKGRPHDAHVLLPWSGQRFDLTKPVWRKVNLFSHTWMMCALMNQTGCQPSAPFCRKSCGVFILVRRKSGTGLATALLLVVTSWTEQLRSSPQCGEEVSERPWVTMNLSGRSLNTLWTSTTLCWSGSIQFLMSSPLGHCRCIVPMLERIALFVWFGRIWPGISRKFTMQGC